MILGVFCLRSGVDIGRMPDIERYGRSPKSMRIDLVAGLLMNITTDVNTDRCSDFVITC